MERRIDEHQDDIKMENSENHPAYYKLNPDCWDEIFDWLSIKDVLAIGKTCKRLNAVAGYHFQQKYKNLSVDIIDGEKLFANDVQINEFGKFIENVSFMETYGVHFQCIPSSCKKSLKRIEFHYGVLHIHQMNKLRNSLKQIEMINLMECVIFEIDFYDHFLKFCPNVKHLIVNNIIIDDIDWLEKKYPNLEYFLFTPKNRRKIEHLDLFLKENSTIKTIETNMKTLYLNWKIFAQCNLKLDDFKLNIGKFEGFEKYINVLHAKGFYKRLHLMKVDKTSVVEKATSMPSLIYIESPFVMELSNLVNLKELNISSDPNLNIEGYEILARRLAHLKRVQFYKTYYGHILKFVRHSTQLREFQVNIILDLPNCILDLAMLNEERKILPGARKIVFYVDQDIFVPTKWAYNKIEYRFVEMKRIEEKINFNSWL